MVLRPRSRRMAPDAWEIPTRSIYVTTASASANANVTYRARVAWAVATASDGFIRAGELFDVNATPARPSRPGTRPENRDRHPDAPGSHARCPVSSSPSAARLQQAA